MELIEFKHRLIESTKELIEFTKSIVKNPISNNVKYLIEPNNREISQHLNEVEINKLNKLNDIQNKLIDFENVSDFLFYKGQTPIWINMEVFYSSNKKTIVKLIISRRFRNEIELNNKTDNFPPFHLTVPIPPWRIENKKFNINWQHQILRKKWHALTWKWRFKKRKKSHTTPVTDTQIL